VGKQIEGFASIGCFRDQFHIGLTPDQGGEAFAQQRMIIYGENLNHTSACFLRKRRRPDLPVGVRYAIEPVMLNSISVPAPGRLQNSNLPPICLARWRIPHKP